MKKVEISKEIKPHSDKFYTNLSVRLVRVIEILTAMSNENNSYLNRVYLGDKIHDLASNLLYVLSENRFEKNTIDIVKRADSYYRIQGVREFNIFGSTVILMGKLPKLISFFI